MKFGKRGLVLIGTATACVLLAACGTQDPSSGDSGSGDLGTLHVVLGAPLANYPAFAPIAVAQQLGYWKEQGLDIDIKGLDGGTAAVQALVTGRGDMSIADPASLLTALSDGKPLGTLSFYTWIRKPEYIISVPADSPIKTLADLKGKTIGVESLGSTDSLAATKILSGANDVPESDVQIVAIGQGAQAMTALQNGQVVAYSGGDNATAALNGIGYQMRDLELPASISEATDATFATTPDFFAKHKDMLVAWGKGFSEAVVFCKENVDACIQLYWKQYPTAKPANADSDFAEASKLMRAVLEVRLPKYYADDGQWGLQLENGMLASASVLDLPNIDPAEVAKLYTNELVSQMSDFDEAAIVKQAQEYKG